MERDEQIRIVKGLMSHLDEGTNVDAGGQLRNPVSSYTCPERAREEWQHFFQDYPQLLGISGDLPEPGTFFTSEELGKPILCTRDLDGTFHAFLNVCRHRGTIVESEARGKKQIFSCPFHAWGYNHGGDLVAVPKEEHFGEVDRSCNALVKLPCVERHGLLFVCPNPDKPFDIDELLGDLGPELASWQLEDSEHRGNTRYDTPMNWKLAIDTFGETYHFNALHRDTLAMSFYGNCQMYDTYERNHRMALCLRTIDLLRNLPESEWHVLKAALPVYYIFPNVQLIVGQGGPTLVRVYPRETDPNDSFSEISFYGHVGMFDAATFEDAGDDVPRRGGTMEERARGFAEVIEQEDYAAAATSHRGALSGAQESVLFGRNEPALHHYHNTYREALGLAPLALET
jgi:phenylpropionate dioxygenase-like ring-hydroxylating dioxygenase large terminal subunit